MLRFTGEFEGTRNKTLPDFFYKLALWNLSLGFLLLHDHAQTKFELTRCINSFNHLQKGNQSIDYTIFRDGLVSCSSMVFLALYAVCPKACKKILFLAWSKFINSFSYFLANPSRNYSYVFEVSDTEKWLFWWSIDLRRRSLIFALMP